MSESKPFFTRRLAALLCSLALLCPLFTAPSAAFSEEAVLTDTGALDEEVAKIFKKKKTAGGMVVIAKDGEIIYESCYGYADKRAKELVSPENYFRLASVSKLVTGVAVMRLADAGRLDLDENLGTILGGDTPYFAANPSYPKIGLTPRHLMSHTGSIRDQGAFSKHKALREILNVKNKTTSGFYHEKPGTKYHYSNYGAGILGCVIEAVTGQRLTEAVRALLFDEMGIDAAYHPTQLQTPEKITSTYKLDEGMITRSYRLKEPYETAVNVDKDYNESYGGLWMRGEDLCKIGILLCEGGMYQGRQLLREETVQEMLSSQAGRGSITVDSPYGLNVERVSNLLPGKMLYGHQGMAEAILCNLYFDPETHFVFALVTNGCNTRSKEDHICLLARDLFGLLWNRFGG